MRTNTGAQPHQLKYLAYKLTVNSDDIQKLIVPLAFSSIDIKPYQIEAALFALHSPFCKGVILADEVGLGKTIEAGLLLSYYWSRGKRKLLVICPASLRKQWCMELLAKFDMKSVIVERGNCDNELFNYKRIIIISYEFAAAIHDKLAGIDWDLCVLDEAHKLRNVYKPESKRSTLIRDALLERKKALLTATPLQNSLMELYGLVSVIDNMIFGDALSFQIRYVQGDNKKCLLNRIKPIVFRTLRADVTQYVNYTNRKPVTAEFALNSVETKFYNAVSDFIAHNTSISRLSVILMYKLLGSSSRALLARLNKMYNDALETQSRYTIKTSPVTITDKLKILIELGESIKADSKTTELLKALELGFEEMRKLGANEKVIIFTEFLRTQEYLLGVLEEKYPGQVIIFNGKNNSSMANEIYLNWYRDNKHNPGNRDINMRTALMEHFKNNAKIMIATEAAAEGLNLQFCSMVVNYDLPWNPQRVEQRIGRCHRYGQKFDVVVINPINKANIVEVRIHQILRDKFKLFNGIFGASDEILGIVGKNIDVENCVKNILATCRTHEEIERAFAELREKMSATIEREMKRARKILREYFSSVSHAFKHGDVEVEKEEHSRNLWRLTKNILPSRDIYARYSFCDNSLVFTREGTRFLKTDPVKTCVSYYLTMDDALGTATKNTTSHKPYSIYTKLGKMVIRQAKKLETKSVRMCLLHDKTSGVKARENGWITVVEFIIDKNTRDIGVAICDDKGRPRDANRIDKILALDAKITGDLPDKPPRCLDDTIDEKLKLFGEKYRTFRERVYDEEAAKIKNRFEDKKISARTEINGIKGKIKELTTQIRRTYNFADRLPLQSQQKKLETQLKNAQVKYNAEMSEINNQHDNSLEKIKHITEPRKVRKRTLFVINYEIVSELPIS